jgi:hypothetical protein
VRRQIAGLGAPKNERIFVMATSSAAKVEHVTEPSATLEFEGKAHEFKVYRFRRAERDRYQRAV